MNNSKRILGLALLFALSLNAVDYRENLYKISDIKIALSLNSFKEFKPTADEIKKKTDAENAIKALGKDKAALEQELKDTTDTTKAEAIKKLIENLKNNSSIVDDFKNKQDASEDYIKHDNLKNKLKVLEDENAKVGFFQKALGRILYHYGYSSAVVLSTVVAVYAFLNQDKTESTEELEEKSNSSENV